MKYDVIRGATAPFGPLDPMTALPIRQVFTTTLGQTQSGNTIRYSPGILLDRISDLSSNALDFDP
jgi:hypothetical protein